MVAPNNEPNPDEEERNRHGRDRNRRGGRSDTVTVDVSMNPHSASYGFNAIGEFTHNTLMRAGDIYSAFKGNIAAGFSGSPIKVTYGVSSPDQDTILSPLLPIPTKVHRSTMSFEIPREFTQLKITDLDLGSLTNAKKEEIDAIARGYLNIKVTAKVYDEAVEQGGMVNFLTKSMPWLDEWIRRRPEETLIAYAKGLSPKGENLFIENTKVSTKAVAGGVPRLISIKDIMSEVPDSIREERPTVDSMIAAIDTAKYRQLDYRSFARTVLGADRDMNEYGELCIFNDDGSLKPIRLQSNTRAFVLDRAMNSILANPTDVAAKDCIQLLTLLKTDKGGGDDAFAIQAGGPLVSRARVLAYKRLLSAQEKNELGAKDKEALDQLSFPRNNIPWYMKDKMAMLLGVAGTVAITGLVVSALSANVLLGGEMASAFALIGVGIAGFNTAVVLASLPVAWYGMRKTFQWLRACYKRKLFENLESVQAIGDPYLMVATMEKMIDDKMYNKQLVKKDQEVRYGKKGIRDFISPNSWSEIKKEWDVSNANRPAASFSSLEEFEIYRLSTGAAAALQPWKQVDGLKGAAEERCKDACNAMNKMTFFLYSRGFLNKAEEIAAKLKDSQGWSDDQIAKRFEDCGGKVEGSSFILPKGILDQQRLLAPLLSSTDRAKLQGLMKDLIDNLELSQDDIINNNILVGTNKEKGSPFRVLNPALAGASVALVQAAGRAQVMRFAEGEFGYRLLGKVFGKRKAEESLAAYANDFQQMANKWVVEYQFSGALSFQQETQTATEIRELAAKLSKERDNFVKKMWVYERPGQAWLAQAGLV